MRWKPVLLVLGRAFSHRRITPSNISMRFFIPFFVLFASLSLTSCSRKDSALSDTSKSDTIAKPRWGVIPLDTNIFNRGTQIGRITDPAMAKASGIATSRSYPGMFYVEDDKAGNSDIYLVDSTGEERAIFNVVGAAHRDWTDMGIGPGPEAKTNYIFIADIGGSKNDSSACNIYRVPEPTIPLGPGLLQTSTTPADKISYTYPDGPRDAETILIDPQSKDIYIVDKNLASNVYYLPYPQSTDTVIVAKKIIEKMPVPDGPLRSGGIATNRSEILMKSYTSIYLWHIAPGESILDALLGTPVTIPITPEVRGEAMCYTPDDKEFWTTSKFKTLPYADLTRYVRR